MNTRSQHISERQTWAVLWRTAAKSDWLCQNTSLAPTRCFYSTNTSWGWGAGFRNECKVPLEKKEHEMISFQWVKDVLLVPNMQFTFCGFSKSPPFKPHTYPIVGTSSQTTYKTFQLHNAWTLIYDCGCQTEWQSQAFEHRKRER